MSRSGMLVAKHYGKELPAFNSLAEAERVLFAQRDATLGAFTADGEAPSLDYTPRSLKALEKWYFDGGCPETGKGGYSMSHAIAFYFGEVLCRTAGFEWFVAEFVFERGRYEIGVRKQLGSIMLTKGKALRREGNKRMESLWREYSTHAA
jgi:hypothetical protein